MPTQPTFYSWVNKNFSILYYLVFFLKGYQYLSLKIIYAKKLLGRSDQNHLVLIKMTIKSFFTLMPSALQERQRPIQLSTILLKREYIGQFSALF